MQYFASQFGFQYVTFNINIKTCWFSYSTYVDIVVSGFVTCKTVIHSLACLFVVFVVQNFTLYFSNYYNYILKMFNET
jgi:hypothetical protein